jgi:tRNA(Arg) A34 adenosine deaminase TadA
MTSPSLTITIPAWLEQILANTSHSLPTLEERMKLAILLARENTRQRGGPFAALVVEEEGGRLIAAGVNLVVPLNCSLAHAEMVAIALAQQQLGSYNLASGECPPLQLVTSTEPCAMCLGALPWSGIRSVVCGARGEDAERAGFDEGAKPVAWPETLARRGVRVIRDICRAEAARVLADYRDNGGIIYNGNSST